MSCYELGEYKLDVSSVLVHISDYIDVVSRERTAHSWKKINVYCNSFVLFVMPCFVVVLFVNIFACI